MAAYQLTDAYKTFQKKKKLGMYISQYKQYNTLEAVKL